MVIWGDRTAISYTVKGLPLPQAFSTGNERNNSSFYENVDKNGCPVDPGSSVGTS